MSINAPTITPIYAALLALGYLYLSFQTIRVRRQQQISIGDRNNKALMRAIRVHANFAEYVPLALLLALLMELMNFHAIVLHAVCLCLMVGRGLHAYGVAKIDEDLKFRIAGTMLTFTSLLTASFSLLFDAVFA